MIVTTLSKLIFKFRLRLKEAGFEVKVAGPEAHKTYKSKEGYWAQSDCVFADIDPAK